MNDVVCEGGTLYIVGTPLGNLSDLSHRAAAVLTSAGRLYAEDTRRARILLDHLGSSVPVRSLHEHNERARQREVIGHLEAGESVAFVSDAGTPAVSDPGADLVAGVAAAGFKVSPVPGPSALATALSVAGFVDSNRSVLFLGFLALKGKGRRRALEQMGSHPGVVVFYESPRRLKATLEDLAPLGEDRPAVVARELTKIHEEVVRGTVGELVTWADREVRGEVTVLLGPPPRAEEENVGGETIDKAIVACLEGGLSARDASTAISAILGLRRRDIYQRINELSASDCGE